MFLFSDIKILTVDFKIPVFHLIANTRAVKVPLRSTALKKGREACAENDSDKLNLSYIRYKLKSLFYPPEML